MAMVEDDRDPTEEDEADDGRDPIMDRI